MDIREYIRYEPETGYFYALKNRQGIKIGDQLGGLTVNGYITLCFNSKAYLGHRLAFYIYKGYWPEKDVDHINGQRSDNSWINLREATRRENMFNRVGNVSKELPRNVYQHKSGRFRVKMKIEGKTKHFGYFDSIEEANDVANSIRKEYHKGFAKTL